MVSCRAADTICCDMWVSKRIDDRKWFRADLVPLGSKVQSIRKKRSQTFGPVPVTRTGSYTLEGLVDIDARHLKLLCDLFDGFCEARSSFNRTIQFHVLVREASVDVSASHDRTEWWWCEKEHSGFALLERSDDVDEVGFELL